MRAGNLVGLLLVRRAGGRPHLRAGLPARVEGLLERILALHGLRQREEAFGHGEGFAHGGEVDPMVRYLEEADVHGGMPEFVGDLGFAAGVVGEVDAADLARAGLVALRTHAGFAGQFVEGGGAGHDRSGVRKGWVRPCLSRDDCRGI
ncbi:hypothetical protein D3C86_1441300 [compost metagenome]